jgi:hypothetical protein
MNEQMRPQIVFLDVGGGNRRRGKQVSNVDFVAESSQLLLELGRRRRAFVAHKSDLVFGVEPGKNVKLSEFNAIAGVNSNLLPEMQSRHKNLPFHSIHRSRNDQPASAVRIVQYTGDVQEKAFHGPALK